MGTSILNNRLIAKNALLLYIRMFILMAISLYTSRIVLKVLGVEDYGIYNVVGGIVMMFSFLNSSMTSSSQRYITFAIGKSDDLLLKKTFIMTVNVHILIAIIIVILAETIGLWFLYEKINIPSGRFIAAFWVYQFSILTMTTMVLSIPYNAIIIAYEKMTAFAYISIIEAILKLTIVYCVSFAHFDKLIIYSALLFVTQLIIRVIYYLYCKKFFSCIRYKWLWDYSFFKEISFFAGWNLFGNIASVLYTQGLNILLNIFFGPFVNAARGIATQVQGAITQFSSNFQIAFNPQITKSYAVGEISFMTNLIEQSSKMIFLLLYSISLPLIIETNYILNIWLTTVPDYTVIFIRIMLITTIIDASSGPLAISAQATGKIKNYQIIIGGILLFIVPISYIVLKLGGKPESVFIVHCIICSIAFIVRLLILRKLIDLNISHYLNNVIIKCLSTIILSLPIPLLLKYFLNYDSISSITIIIISLLSSICCSYFFGLNKQEQKFVMGIFNKFIR